MMPNIETSHDEEEWKKDIINNPLSSCYNTREAALVRAHNLVKEESYPIEYGVIEL